MSLLQRLDALLDAGQLGLGERPHLGVGRLVGEQRLEVGEFAFGAAQLPDPGRPCPAARNIPRRA